MTNGNYDWDAFYNITLLQQSCNREDQERLNQLLYTFGSENGWKICASFLLRDNSFNEIYKQTNDLDLKDFFCFRGIEEYIKLWYSNTNNDNVDQIHMFILKIIEFYISNKNDKKENFLRNKCIHIATIIAIIDYPTRWMSFFKDFIYIIHKDYENKTISSGDILGFELFFKFLISWDAEVCSREMQVTEFLERNTRIKDWMRDHDIVNIIEIVAFVITNIGMNNTKLFKKAVKVISLYISWIDIRLVVNDAILDGILKPLLPNIDCEDSVKSSSLYCLMSIINKGMSDCHKLELIGFLNLKLAHHGIWQWLDMVRDIPDDLSQDFGCDEDENENCFFVTFGSFINSLGMNLIDCFKSMNESKTGDFTECLRMIHNKLKLAFIIVKCNNNSVSITCLPLLQNFINLLKGIYKVETKKIRRNCISKMSVQMTNEEDMLVKGYLSLMTSKVRYPSWYNFEKEDEIEGNFQSFRRQLMNILTNIIQLDDQIVMKYLLELLQNVIRHLDSLEFQDIEMVLAMIYHLGESVKSVKGDYFCSECEISRSLKEIMQALCSSNIGRHKNSEVRLMFFEVIFRYEKFLNYNPEYLMDIILLFLSEHGLKCNELRVVTRCVYIMSRLIKTHKSKFGNASVSILREITTILHSSFMNNEILTCDNQSTINAYSYLFETASMLLVTVDVKECHQIFHNLVHTIVMHLPQLCTEWSSAAATAIPSTDPVLHSQNINNIKANRAALSIHSAATYVNYACRAFSGSFSMSELNCLDVFMNALDIFIVNIQVAFNSTKHPLAVGREKINSGLRSLIHILCKAAQSDSVAISAILQRLPHAIELFLSHLSLNVHGLLAFCSELEEIIPLFMQIINGFKNQSIDFLKSSLWTLFSISNSAMKASSTVNYNSNDLEQEVDVKVRQLKRLYLQLISCDVNIVFMVLSNEQIVQLLSSCVHLIHDVEHIDPISVKLCVQVFNKIITVLSTFINLDQQTKETILYQLIYKQLLPLIIYLPSCENFNLADPPFHLALVEMANCQRSMFLNGGSQFINYLQIQCLPELNFNSDLILQYCQGLNHNEKDYQPFLKNFYLKAKHK